MPWGDRREITGRGSARDVLVVACAISAGIHAALTPDHFAEGTGSGLGFAAAAVLLASLVVALTMRPEGMTAVAASAAVLAGLLVSYALATTTGLPVLHPDAEPIDGLAVATKLVETVGLLAAVHLLRGGRLAVPYLRPKGLS
jgi:hypothetical protein